MKRLRPFNRLAFFCGAHSDWVIRTHAEAVPAASNPADFCFAPGGAALNAASIAVALGLPAMIASPIGDDPDGAMLEAICEERGIEPRLAVMSGEATGRYAGVFSSDGALVIGAAGLGIYEKVDAAWTARHFLPELVAGDAVFLTSNAPGPALQDLARAIGGRFLAAAAISPAKATRLKPLLARIDLLFASIAEARAMTGLAAAAPHEAAAGLMKTGCGAGIITDGVNPVTFWKDGTMDAIPVIPVRHHVNANGAGDALAGAMLAGLHAGLAFADALIVGMEAARRVVAIEGTWPQDLRGMTPQALLQGAAGNGAAG